MDSHSLPGWGRYMLKENLKKSEYVVVHLRGGRQTLEMWGVRRWGKMGVLGFPNVSSMGMFVEFF